MPRHIHNFFYHNIENFGLKLTFQNCEKIQHRKTAILKTEILKSLPNTVLEKNNTISQILHYSTKLRK